MESFITLSTFKVEWIHRGGYQAPSYYVEVSHYKFASKTDVIREAVGKAKEKSRLADFPKVWYCKVNDVTTEPPRRGKKGRK